MNSTNKLLPLSPQANQAIVNGKKVVRDKLIQILEEQKMNSQINNTLEITNKIIKSNKEVTHENLNESLKTTSFPNTLEERKKIHKSICGYAFHPKGPSGLTAYLKRITNAYDLRQIIKWIELYSKIEVEKEVNGAFLFRKKANHDLFSPKIGLEKPYYEIDVTSKSDRYKALTLIPPSTKGSTQKSSKDFQKKVLKSCLDDFLASPSLENQKRLNNLIESYINSPSTKGGRITVSGGLPGLGKRR